MNHMNTPDEEEHNWQHEYGHYEGPEQKIRGDDDELFASMSAQKMKSALGDNRNPPASQRLVLAIVSICATVVLFGLLVLALALKIGDNDGASVALGWGFVITCVMIFAVNRVFNGAGSTPDKTASDGQKKNNEQKQTN